MMNRLLFVENIYGDSALEPSGKYARVAPSSVYAVIGQARSYSFLPCDSMDFFIDCHTAKHFLL